MPELPGLVPIVFTILAYVACIKLAARLFQRTQLSWKHALLFGVLLFVVLFVVGGLLRWLNPVSGPVLASVVYLAVDLAAQLTVGGWFLGPRARTKAGMPVELKGGALLALISYALVFVLSLAATAVLPFFARMAGIGVS